MTKSPKIVTINSQDGSSWQASLFLPTVDVKGTIVFANGMGVASPLYFPLASSLAECGYRAVLFDYVGIYEDARDLTAKEEVLTLSDWSKQTGCTISWIRSQFDREPVFGFGHSIGCPIICLSGELANLNKFVQVAGQNAYWRNWPTPMSRCRIWLHWHVLFPMFTNIFGRLPRSYWKGTALPGGAARQWARWGKYREYFLSDASESHKSQIAMYSGDVLAIRFENDPFAPPKAVEAFLQQMPKAKTTRLEYSAGDNLRHFSFFKSCNKSIWIRDVVKWLESNC